jgi:hypothetical protein
MCEEVGGRMRPFHEPQLGPGGSEFGSQTDRPYGRGFGVPARDSCSNCRATSHSVGLWPVLSDTGTTGSTCAPQQLLRTLRPSDGPFLSHSSDSTQPPTAPMRARRTVSAIVRPPKAAAAAGCWQAAVHQSWPIFSMGSVRSLFK